MDGQKSRGRSGAWPAAPSCFRTGCDAKVGRVRPRQPAGRLGERWLHGVRWKWFCSKRCQATWCGEQLDPETRRQNGQKGIATRTAEYQARILDELRRAVGDQLGPDGRTTPEALLPALLAVVRRVQANAWDRGRDTQIRANVAAVRSDRSWLITSTG